MIRKTCLLLVVISFCFSSVGCVTKRVTDDTHGRVTYGHVER